MLTGLQILKARMMLGWGQTKFSHNAHITEALVTAIESSDGPAWLTDEQEVSIRRAIELPVSSSLLTAQGSARINPDALSVMLRGRRRTLADHLRAKGYMSHCDEPERVN